MKSSRLPMAACLKSRALPATAGFEWHTGIETLSSGVAVLVGEGVKEAEEAARESEDELIADVPPGPRDGA